VSAPTIDLSFPHHWQAEILSARPLILPPRHFVYPRDAEEVERGALEVLVQAQIVGAPGLDCQTWDPFLATCALGFRDPAVPTGLWSTPEPEKLCAVSGGYAYIIDTTTPDRFTMIPHRPVLAVHSLPSHHLLLFVAHHALLAWGRNGQAWQSPKLSDEGVTITAIANNELRGRGWDMMADQEIPFTLDLKTGQPAS
jgi:hypothetical protein